MDFQLNDEQRQFGDALQRWVTRDYPFAERARIIGSEAGVSDAAWAKLTELGMTALPVPEAQGGFNGGARDMFVVMQELGRGLVVEPYFATMLGAEMLRLGGVHLDLLKQVAAGQCKLACALGEAQSRHDLADVATSALRDQDAYVINGRKVAVIHGGQAHQLIVSVRLHGEQREQAGVALLLVPADAPGVRITGYRTLDGLRAADIVFENVTLPASALVGGWDVLDAGADYGAALLCAEALGALEALFGATLEYLKTRSQFGVPIGKFQALQHRMADMAIHLEQARSMALLAAVKAGADDGDERRRSVSAAKYRIGQAIRFIGQQAIQLHGGMGMTDELPASHYFKRLTMIELTLGDSDHHLARFMAQAGFMPETAEIEHA
jgi:alkylation response protein AidB-like acyl-CoA dehydrogenase